MIKHGRPYSNENGWVDKALITDRPAGEMETAMKWIRENIFPAEAILPGRTSYGLKHTLHRDTGLYLTNNVSSKTRCCCPVLSRLIRRN